jgi:hypothetical protein
MHFHRPHDGHEPPARAYEARGTLADISADEVEHEVDFADVLQLLVVEIDIFVGSEV